MLLTSVLVDGNAKLRGVSVVSKCQNVKMSKSQKVRMSKCQNVKMPKCQNAKNVKMSKYPNVQMPTCQNAKISKCQNVIIVANGNQIILITSCIHAHPTTALTPLPQPQKRGAYFIHLRLVVPRSGVSGVAPRALTRRTPPLIDH